MRRPVEQVIAMSMTLTVLTTMLAPPGTACAPEMPQAVLISGIHPDHPFKLFAAGHIGIVQRGWAKSYLCIAYRYLIGKPLSKTEQDSAVNLWHTRLRRANYWAFNQKGGDKTEDYLTTRAKALGMSLTDRNGRQYGQLYSKVDSFAYHTEIGDDAFVLANKTLKERVKQFGVKSAAVKEWIKAQDTIFGINGDKIVVPPQLPKTASPLLRADRAYQIAAATFYLQDYKKAESLFKAISLDSTSPYQKLSEYLVLRSKERHVTKDSDVSNEDWTATTESLKKAAAKTTKTAERENVLNLLRPVSYVGRSSQETVIDLADSITKGTSQRFGGDVGDLTFLMDEGAGSTDGTTEEAEKADSDYNKFIGKPDIIDWVRTTQTCSEWNWDEMEEQKKKRRLAEVTEQGQHALKKWRGTKTLPWLVSAVSALGLRSGENKDLFDAANKVTSNSPAFYTCKFYVIDSLIAANKKEEARKHLTAVLASKNLPPTTFNLFSAQMAAVASSPQEYLQHAVLKTSEEVTYTECVSSDLFKLAKLNSFHNETPAVDVEVADDLNRNAPLALWVSLAQNRAVDSRFRAIISRTAWLRALLLGKQDVAVRLENDVAATNPRLAQSLATIRSSQPGAASKFAIACLVLRNYGMSPYLQGGAERNGSSVDEFSYYNNNFWQPLEEKGKESDRYNYSTVDFQGNNAMRDLVKEYWNPGLTGRLSAAEKKAVAAECKKIADNHPSLFLGQAVLDWAKSHPKDKHVPEMLYRVVKLPKWSGESTTGSEFSKKAYLVLHGRYPGNAWTKKAVCYY